MPTLKRKREPDTPFNIDQKAHFKGCGEDEIMLTTQEQLQLEQTLKPEVVDVPGNSSRKRRKTTSRTRNKNPRSKDCLRRQPRPRIF